MQLDNIQKAKVGEWVRQGMKLAEVQNKIISEFGLKMTYMEVRFLVDDLKVTPVDPEPVQKPQALPEQTQAEPTPAQPNQHQADTLPAGGAKVSLSVDQLARPGALVSGKVVFSDGKRAAWYLDEAGRLGISPEQAGYRPAQADIQQFQALLPDELAKLGF